MTSPEQALNVRITTHERFAKYEINDWILSTLKLKRGEEVLDVGCGNGKQLIPYAKEVGPEGSAVGLDISLQLLEEAARNAERAGVRVQLKRSGMEDLPSTLQGRKFDVVSCCFALYYSNNYRKTILDFWDALRDGGRCFVCGPMSGNNAELTQLHAKVATVPPAFTEHTKFLEERALPLFLERFKRVERAVFRNPVIFPDKASLLDYWKSYTLFDEQARSQFEKMVDEAISKNGKFATNKVVLGITAFK